ncbi:hypothetical protein MSG28_004756 [Choristoneura fumiferana]|uniref:Uncharacterized protein n=1 Tax=Choristoneura fumiferana TaxID=7141 RepID=A0ACC0K7D5_CHOFU|nr:hypothetical protein MSG28_004756 [Choristoneura fumiferana]
MSNGNAVHYISIMKNLFFFRDEPMNRAVELLETPDARCPELEDYASSSLSDGVSIAAFDDLGEMEADYTDKSEECSNLKFRRIIKVLGHLDREARIWDKVAKHCNKVVEIRIASTHSEWRGRGLMRKSSTSH